MGLKSIIMIAQFFFFSGENQLLSQMSPHLLIYDIHFLLKWTLQNSLGETVKSTKKHRIVPQHTVNGFWGIRIICGHSTDNCYYCLSQKKRHMPTRAFTHSFSQVLSGCCFRRCFCSHIGNLQTPWLKLCPFCFPECLTLGLFMKSLCKEAVSQRFYSSFLPLCIVAVVFEMQMAAFWNYVCSSAFHVLEFLGCKIA